jgi:DNA processing protein
VYVRGTLPKGGVAEFAFGLASRLGEPVLAGLARGIDTAAHRGALAAGVPTVAFVGYGFGNTYPPENVELEEEIVRGGGAIATLLPPGTPVSDGALIERDRLQAEHARAVVLVCTEIGGGAMHTMQFARELGRPRFAVTPPAGAELSPEWAGNVECIADGAAPLPFDVARALTVLRD